MIVFGSRGSDLALAQTRAVAESLRSSTGVDFEIRVIETRGDRELDRPLPQIGGKGLFTKELENALLQDTIDAAVHSLKDLPVEDAGGLKIGAITARVDARDVLVFDPACEDFEGGSLPVLGDCRIGTSSPRRAHAITCVRPDLEVADIRGNVPTRIAKVRRGDYHGVILAAAGLERLARAFPDLTAGLRVVPLAIDTFTPAPGQGALAIQCRSDDERVSALLTHVHDDNTALCVTAERQLLSSLGGGCSLPLGAYAQPSPGCSGFGFVTSLFGPSGAVIRIELNGPDPLQLATTAHQQLAPFIGQPLAGKSVALLRQGGGDSRLAAALALTGAVIETVALSELRTLACSAADLAPARGAVVAFTSARAVDRFFEECAVHDIDVSQCRFYAVGPATAEAMLRRGVQCRCPDSPRGGAELARLLTQQLGSGSHVFFPCAQDRNDGFESGLAAAGIDVTALPLYRMEPLRGIELPKADYHVLASPAVVAAIDTLPGRPDACIALGETTAAAMRSAALEPIAVATTPTADALANILLALTRP